MSQFSGIIEALRAREAEQRNRPKVDFQPMFERFNNSLFAPANAESTATPENHPATLAEDSAGPTAPVDDGTHQKSDFGPLGGASAGMLPEPDDDDVPEQPPPHLDGRRAKGRKRR